MEITLDQIKSLRDSTGVSISACKKALEEAGGDFDKAIEVLRKKGETKAAERSERSTSNGVIGEYVEDSAGVMIELRCETDFVAMDAGFIELAGVLAKKIFNGEVNPSDEKIQDIVDAGLRLGENIKLGTVKRLEGETIGTYIHSNKRMGAIVALKGGDVAVAKDIAMHIVASNPKVVSPTEISDELVQKEKTIWADQLKNEGKPAEIVEKIMMGKEKKFREENALIKQQFVKDPEKTVEMILAPVKAEVLSFSRFAI